MYIYIYILQKDNVIYGNCGTFESAIPTAICIDDEKIGLYQWEEEKLTLIKEFMFQK